MSEGSEVRKTSRNEQDESKNLRQRRSCCSFSAFCSFYESRDDGSWAGDENPWPVPALFHAVAVLAQGSPTGAKGWASPVVPAPTSEPRSGPPTDDSS